MNPFDYQRCIEACDACASACERCATACLAERDVADLRECIALDLDCAAICRSTSSSLSRDSPLAEVLVSLCARICAECAAECARHSHDHCRACADACSRCAEVCLGSVEAVVA